MKPNHPQFRKIAVILIILAAAISYSNTFNSSFHFDDFPRIVNNPDITEFAGPLKIMAKDFTRSIGHLSFALNYMAGGQSVTGYHVINLLVHIINAFLVYWFASMIGRCQGTSNNAGAMEWLPIIASLLFVTHPIQTQAVTYIVQRVTSLATLFYLLTLCLYLKSSMTDDSKEHSRALLFLSYLSCLAAIFTKEIAATLPVAVLLVDYFFVRGTKIRSKEWIIRIAPYLLLLFVVPGIVFITRKSTGIGAFPIDTKWGHSRLDYLLTQIHVVRTYLRMIILPFGQSLDHHFPVITTFFNPSTLLSFTVLVALGATGMVAFKRNRIISFGILFFFLALAVESTLVPIRDVIYEHRLYLPSVGLFLAIGSGVLIFIPKLFRAERTGSAAVIALIFVWVGTLSMFTFQRNKVWKNEFTLWQDVVNKGPGKARGHYNLGNALVAVGKKQTAIQSFHKAIEIDPDYKQAYNNLGGAYRDIGEEVRALTYLKEAMRLEPNNEKVYNNLGLTYNAMGRYEDAIAAYQKAISLNGRYSKAFNNLAVAYYYAGEHHSAHQYAIRAMALGYRVHPVFLDSLKLRTQEASN